MKGKVWPTNLKFWNIKHLYGKVFRITIADRSSITSCRVWKIASGIFQIHWSIYFLAGHLLYSDRELWFTSNHLEINSVIFNGYQLTDFFCLLMNPYIKFKHGKIQTRKQFLRSVIVVTKEWFWRCLRNYYREKNFYVSSFDNEAENNVTRSDFFGSCVGSFLLINWAVHIQKTLVIKNYHNPNIQFLIKWSLIRSLNIFKKGNGKTKFLFL